MQACQDLSPEPACGHSKEKFNFGENQPFRHRTADISTSLSFSAINVGIRTLQSLCQNCSLMLLCHQLSLHTYWIFRCTLNIRGMRPNFEEPTPNSEPSLQNKELVCGKTDWDVGLPGHLLSAPWQGYPVRAQENDGHLSLRERKAYFLPTIPTLCTSWACP